MVAKQLEVDIQKITAATSLAELKADELDVAELVMDIEDKFKITIPDEKLTGGEKAQQAMQDITVGKLAALVDELKGK